MNDTIPYFDCTRQVRKRFKSFKPYWNESLDQHWNEMRLKKEPLLNVMVQENGSTFDITKARYTF